MTRRYLSMFALLVAACSEDDSGRPPAPRSDSCAVCARGKTGSPSVDGGLASADAGAGAAPCICAAPTFQSESFAGCLFGSPLRYDGSKGTVVVVVSGDGRVAAISPTTGKTAWSVPLPVSEGKSAYALATPALVGDGRLVVAWQEAAGGTPVGKGTRETHRVAVVDLERGAIDAAFAPVTLAATQKSFDGDPIEFRPEFALSHSALAYMPNDGGRGYVYVTFGNARDLQPWHGWVFELDLDAWHDSGKSKAISATLVTTPETDCGKEGHSGAHEKTCGGGVWAPAGPEVVRTDTGFELVVPTGNGALDPTRHDYSHSLMRVRGPGLAFTDGCDPELCEGWDVEQPSMDCMQSCENLFIPRFADESTTFDVAVCGDRSFFGCYSALDWDLGAGSPTAVDIPDGPRGLLLPAKDGGLYLTDLTKLGTLYDRLQIAEPCGSHGAACSGTWAGMMVTKPVVAVIDGQPMAVVPSFNYDDTNGAGLVGVRIRMKDGVPRLEKAWEAPPFDSQESVEGFRHHSTGVVLMDIQGEPHAAVVDVGSSLRPGLLYVVRVRDGAIRVRQSLAGAGQRFAQPLAVGDRLFIPSCLGSGSGAGTLESLRIR